MRSSLSFLLCCVLAAPASADLEEALAREIARSTSSLRQEGYPLPYYIGLRVSDVLSGEHRCSAGGLKSSAASRQRLLTPELRVGGYELDNHPLGASEGFKGREMPDGADELSVRHFTWFHLDAEYKKAAAALLRKQALRVRRGPTEYDTDDRSRQTPLRRDFPRPDLEREREAFEGAGRQACLEASRGLAGRTHVLDSQAELSWQALGNLHIDSEGSRVRYGDSWFRLQLEAEGLSPEGMRTKLARSYMARDASGLPQGERLSAEIQAMAEDMAALTEASSTSPFNAPALLDPSVGAAVLQAFALRLSGEQQRDPDGAQTFRDKLGKAVMPPFLSLEDDPTLREFRGRALLGHYHVDEEGVEPRRTVLVENGVLRGFLLSRHPVIGFGRSNGHGRAAPGLMPTGRAGNLFLRSNRPLSKPHLLELLREECRRRGKPYGVYIQGVRSWRQQDKTGQQQALRLVPTRVYLVETDSGRQTLVRDLDLVGTPLDLAGRILAAGDDFEVTDSLSEHASGSLPTSTVNPSLLLQEVELQRSELKPERPMVLPPPTP